jgi:hypothetical protein
VWLTVEEVESVAQAVELGVLLCSEEPLKDTLLVAQSVGESEGLALRVPLLVLLPHWLPEALALALGPEEVEAEMQAVPERVPEVLAQWEADKEDVGVGMEA